MTDLKAALDDDPVDLGPIGQALTTASYETIVLLFDHDKKTSEFVKWISKNLMQKWRW